jgi:hypothetical protein
MGALAAMAAFFIRKVYNELHGIDPDYQLTIPIGIDSKSAMDTAVSCKETQRTRHFSRNFSFYSTRNRVIPNYLIQSRRHGKLLQLPDQTLTSGSIV